MRLWPLILLASGCAVEPGHLQLDQPPDLRESITKQTFRTLPARGAGKLRFVSAGDVSGTWCPRSMRLPRPSPRS